VSLSAWFPCGRKSHSIALPGAQALYTALMGYVRAHKPGWVCVASQLLDRSPHIGLRGAVVLFAHGCPRMCGELGSQRTGLAARVRPHIIRFKLHHGGKRQHT
jgi:hypothetical protein